MAEAMPKTAPRRRRATAAARSRCRSWRSSSATCRSRTSSPRRASSGEVQPDVQVQVNLDAKKRGAENQYEVITKLKINVEEQGHRGRRCSCWSWNMPASFTIENVPEEQLHPFLLIECPRMMFPFVRRIVVGRDPRRWLPAAEPREHRFRGALPQEIARRQASRPAGQPEAAPPDSRGPSVCQPERVVAQLRRRRRHGRRASASVRRGGRGVGRGAGPPRPVCPAPACPARDWRQRPSPGCRPPISSR